MHSSEIYVGLKIRMFLDFIAEKRDYSTGDYSVILSYLIVKLSSGIVCEFLCLEMK